MRASERHRGAPWIAMLLAIGCAGERAGEIPMPLAQRASAPVQEAEEAPEQRAITPDPAPAPQADFEAPLPQTPCPTETRIALAHRSAPELPIVLGHAIAQRAEDGRRMRIVLASSASLELDALGRLPAPSEDGARLIFEAIRTRRGAIEVGRLGPPSSRNGGLTHVRIERAGPSLTFGAREIGSIEITEIAPERVCGRIDLDDGFGRARGAFSAAIVASLRE